MRVPKKGPQSLGGDWLEDGEWRVLSPRAKALNLEAEKVGLEMPPGLCPVPSALECPSW